MSDPAQPFGPIADCEICARLPPKAEEDVRERESQIVMPLYGELRALLSLGDSGLHQYASSTTRLLQCPRCGTYYYFNRYRDDGEHFMDPTADDLTLLRYSPARALEFLERAAEGGAGAVPNTVGQLAGAFLGGGDVPATQIVAEPRAARERERLLQRYPALIAELRALLRRPALAWHLRQHAVVGLCHHYAAAGDWRALSATLLRSRDMHTRLLAARLVLSIGAGHAPTLDTLHTPAAARSFMRASVARPRRVAALTSALLEVALRGGGETQEYDVGIAGSRYRPTALRRAALYGLVTAAACGGDFSAAAPQLLSICLRDRPSTEEAAWALAALVRQRPQRAPQLIAALSALLPAEQAQLRAMPPVQRLLEGLGVRG